MCFDYDEYADAVSTTVRKARKEHRCDGCRQKITRGDRYEEQTGIFEGRPYRTKTCGACLLDLWKVHVHELAEGCAPWQSWCAPSELQDYLRDTEQTPSPRESGQRWMQLCADVAKGTPNA